MKSLSPERGGGLPKDTQRALGKGDPSLRSSVVSDPWLCPLPITGSLGQAHVWPDAVCQAVSRSMSQTRY